MEVEERRYCEFWLPNKRRFCANVPLPNSSFCGNHNPSANGERVPCPIDPSHSVSIGNLDSHVKKCPMRKHVSNLESQPFYKKGINWGSGSSECQSFVGSEEKRSFIFKLTVPEFLSLIHKIKSTHSTIAAEIPDSYSVPEACHTWMKQTHDRQLPFQEKHAQQQASILGNMERFGILERKSYGLAGDEANGPAVVEFGAGRGYLTQMLTDCYGMRKAFLVERRSYKLKADRSLRQTKNISIERLRIDIEDLNLKAVENLKGQPYLAVGKHICGPATDLTLRCCLPGRCNGNESISSLYLKGLAIATCCHHLCQWHHYINKKFLEDMRITKDDFHAITWFSSWAVDATHSSGLSIAINEEEPSRQIDTYSEKKQTEKGDKDVDAEIRNMKAVEGANFGLLCKEIIDVGRLLWLKEQGLDAHLVKYVPSNISPENHLLVANSGTKL